VVTQSRTNIKDVTEAIYEYHGTYLIKKLYAVFLNDIYSDEKHPGVPEQKTRMFSPKRPGCSGLEHPGLFIMGEF